MDALSEIMHATRLSSGVFLHGNFSEPWRLKTSVTASDCSAHLGPADHLILFHFVLEGLLTVEMRDGMRKEFLPGQAAIFPHNDPHDVGGVEPAPVVSSFDVASIPKPGELMALNHGGGGARTRIICGFLGGRHLGGNLLIGALPSLMTYDSARADSGQLVRSALEIAERNITDSRPGGEAMLARLSELLFIEAVRLYLEAPDRDLKGVLAALKDQVVSRAIALIHRHPDRPWTVDALARDAGASRSTLTEKFARCLQCAPVEYLTQHRMQLAAHMLETSNRAIMDIAQSVGYGSEAAFSRAFKRHHGSPPSALRKAG